MNLDTVLTATTATGAAVVGGLLYGFSAFVMRGLDATPPGAAVRTMQELNRFAPRAPLLVPLVGTALLCLLLAVRAVLDLRDGGERPWWVLAGAALYLAAFVITAAYHVPRNDALMSADPTAADVAGVWKEYAVGWTRMNHVRSAAAIGGAVAFVVSLVR